MALNTQVIGGFKTGMDQQTRQGGKEGAQTLWSLKNGFVNARGDVLARPGLTLVANVTDSAGLYGFQGQLHVFHGDDAYVDPGVAIVTAHLIRYPEQADGTIPDVKAIPFVGAILGKLYLAVDFVGGLIRQYWLQEPAAWKPGTAYLPNAMVQPTVPDGFYYAAETPSTAQVWKPNTVYAVGDKVQPTTSNGYYYVITDATGDATSGAVEPVWPTEEGALVFEGSDASVVPSSTTGSTNPANAIDPAIKNRYDLLSGNKGIAQ